MTRKLLITWLLFLTVHHVALAQVPVANFSANRTSGCAPLTVSFKDESTGNPTFWNWDFGGGNLSNIQNPAITFANPGTYSVTLVVRNADGTNGITKTSYITVNPSPKAQFTVDKTVACLPGFIQFTDASDPIAGTIASWEWDFGDGTTSTERSPRHEYTAVGFYSVTLKVTSTTGCQNVISYGRLIRIVSGVAPEFSFSAPATCRAPFNVDFKNLTSGPGTMSYQWNFGNGGSSTQETPSTTYPTGGTYTVTLNATSEFGCSNSIQKVVDISGTGTTFNGPDTICINTSASFTNAATSVVGTTWDFGNGQQATTKDGASTYNTAGIFTVKMVNTYDNCKDSASRPLVVIDKPAVDFNAPTTTACKGPLTVDFQASAPNAVDWQWNFGDGSTGTGASPSHTYANLGQYDVTLTITTRQGCTNTITKPAFVRIVTPVVGFSNAPTGDCIPFTYTPVASANSVEPVTRYDWIYGDGFTTSTTNSTGPAHIYNNAGNYTLRVIITTASGCTAAQEVVNGVRTGTPPAADFSINVADACASDAIQFTFVPTGAVPVDEWKWEFGDGNTSDEKDPQHRFADSGVFNVTLRGLNNKCPSPAVTKQVHIKPPIALFHTDVNCANGLTVNFVDESKIDIANYGPVTYTWDFGDGNTSNATGSVGHTYAQPGTYQAKLTVTSTNAGGCSHTFEKEVVLPGQQADFTVTPTAVCRNAEFTMTAINNDPTKITGFDWAFGNQPFFVGGISVTTKLPDAGVYDITLRITDINGCTSEKKITNAITISGPVANFTPAVTGACADKEVTFTDLTASIAPIQSWTFDFGDGQVQSFNGGPFTHRFANAGKYPVKLTVTDNNNCSDTYTSTDTVFINKPQAGFSGAFTTICPDTDLPFADTSAGNITGWRWEFGDGSSATSQSPIHRYSATSGTYSVKLVITDNLGCQDSTSKQDYITVKKPVPGFTAIDTSSICPLLETKFTFAGSDYESYYWDFGDGSTSTLLNPKHFYNTYGAYTAKLYVVGYSGCLDSASKVINVFNPITSTDMNYSPITSCNSLMVDFSIVTPASTRFTFFYGDGVIDNSQQKTFQHFYGQPGFYPPSLLLQDSLGCQVNVGGPNTIQIIGALPLFGVDKKAFCDQGTVNFTNYTIGNDPVTSENWDFGDGVTATDLNPTHQYTSAGTFVVKHNVSTQQGCQSTITDTIRVYATPDPRITGDTIACINEPLALQAALAVPDTAVTWKWDLGSNGQSVDDNVSVKYTQSGTYTVGLEASNKLGCKDNTTRTLFVPPAPVITVVGGNNVTLPVGIGVTLPMTYSDGIASYTWTPARDLSCTDCATPVANPKFTTTYSVRVADTYGCTATAGVTVNVVCNKENYFVPNTFSPNGDGQNDVFMPRGRSIDRVSRMQIFNRWGEMVFERRNFAVNDKSAGWDGTHKGKPAVADVYVYVIEFVCDNASVIPFRGNVTLLR